MAQLQDTAGDMRRVANFFKGITAAADVIERLGSLENATNEAKSDLAKAEVARDGVIQAHKDIQAKCKALLAETKEEADKMLADGEAIERVYADKSRAEIDAYNKANTDAAVKFAAAQVDAANTVMAKATIERDALTAQAITLGAEVIDLESKRALAQAEFDKLTKALDKIKSQFKIE